MIANEEMPLSGHDILDTYKCKEICGRVMMLRDLWVPRASTGDFFTLGTASYLDAISKQHNYFDLAAARNIPLGVHFGWLHERIRLFFELFLGEMVFYDPYYALPGFHIFIMDGSDRRLDKSALRAHFDLQWMNITSKTPNGALSFTLPLELPTGGSSMHIWQARYLDAVRLGVGAAEYASNHDPQIVPYEMGRMVVHDGLVLHAIGGSSLATPKGYRITLQGHGVRRPAGWMLYW